MGLSPKLCPISVTQLEAGTFFCFVFAINVSVKFKYHINKCINFSKKSALIDIRDNIALKRAAIRTPHPKWSLPTTANFQLLRRALARFFFGPLGKNS